VGGGGGSGALVTAGLIAAFESNQNVSLAAGTTVAGWLDGSGRGNDLVAAGAPTLVDGATPTGRPAIAFDGTGDLLERVNATSPLNGLISGNADRTMFFVVDYLDPEGVNSGLGCGNGADNEAFGLVAGTDGDLALQGWGAGNDFDSNVDGAGPGWLVQSVVLDNDVFTQYLNGVEIDTGAHVYNTGMQRLVLGAEISDLGESRVDIAAAFIFDRALTEPERMDMETYLQTNYIDDNFIFA
jgi:hypothetical protein